MGSENDEQFRAILYNADKDQLNKYLNDEEACESLCKSSNEYKSLLNEKESLQQANKKLAESNLNKEPVLERVKKELTESIKEFEKSKQEYASLKETYDAVGAVGDMSLSSIYNALVADAIKCEEETDRQADEFFCSMSGSMHTEEELNAFQKKFLESRTQAHLKKIKAEKMKELLPSY
jgi:ESCRT-I complex subunit VPS37